MSTEAKNLSDNKKIPKKTYGTKKCCFACEVVNESIFLVKNYTKISNEYYWVYACYKHLNSAKSCYDKLV